MAKYDVKEIERAKRSVLQEMFAEFGLEWNDSLKNDELRVMLYKANEDYVAPEESKESAPTDETSESQEGIEEPTDETSEEQPEEKEVSDISSVIAQRRLKTAKTREAELPTISLAIRNRRASQGVMGSVSDAIRQRRLGKK